MIDDGFKMRYQDFVEDNKKINLKDLISITNYEKF